MEHGLLPLYVNKILYDASDSWCRPVSPTQPCFVSPFWLLKKERTRMVSYSPSYSYELKLLGKKKRRRSHLCNPIFFLSDVKSNHHLDNSPSVSAPAYSSPIASWEGGWEQLLQPLPQVSHVDLSELFSLDVSFFYTRSWELNQGLVLVCLCVVCVPGVGRSQRDS